jgi:hypothetical protein
MTKKKWTRRLAEIFTNNGFKSLGKLESIASLQHRNAIKKILLWIKINVNRSILRNRHLRYTFFLTEEGDWSVKFVIIINKLTTPHFPKNKLWHLWMPSRPSKKALYLKILKINKQEKLKKELWHFPWDKFCWSSCYLERRIVKQQNYSTDQLLKTPYYINLSTMT